MREKLRRLWPILKLLLGATILVMIGVRFWHDLQQPQLWRRSLQHPEWLLVAGLLYLLGIGCSALYWQRLLRRLGQNPPLLAVVRAYYLGHLGKYVPGKAWALVLRASLIGDAGVRPGLATLTSFYEVLVTMASGVLLAALLFALFARPSHRSFDFELIWGILQLQAEERRPIGKGISVTLALLLSVPVLLPILPPVFNRIVHQVSLPFRQKDTPAPAIPWLAFLDGLYLTAFGWLLLGASLALVLQAGHDLPTDELGTMSFLAQLPAIVGVAYVAGFMILLTPGGLGVREFMLTLFLTPELETLLRVPHDEARGLAVQSVIILRLVWTAAELALAAVVYWLRSSPQTTEH